jgi:hypothetical protein
LLSPRPLWRDSLQTDTTTEQGRKEEEKNEEEI